LIVKKAYFRLKINLMNNTENKYDTFYRRIIARFIDFAIFIVINFIISFIFSLLQKPKVMQLSMNNNINSILETKETYQEYSFDLISDWFIHNNFYITLLFLIYMILTNYFFSGSIGKMLVGIKVIEIEETCKPSFINSFKRSLFGIIYLPFLYLFEDNFIVIIGVLVFYILNAFQISSNKKKLTFEDIIAKTVVIKSK